jgi:hypothetical protein
MLKPVLRTTALLTAFAALAACRSSGPAGESETGEDGPNEVYPTPVLVDPASGKIELEHDEIGERPLRVSNFVPGRTQVRIDGKSVGTLLSPSPIGYFDNEVLILFWEGALVRGNHKVQLATPGTTGAQTSTPIDIIINTGKIPTVTQELGASPIGQADRIRGVGTGARGLLTAIVSTGPTDAELILYRTSGMGWDTQGARTVPLPGYVHDTKSEEAFVSATVLQSEGEPDRIRVAWRVGMPGSRLDARELTWGDTDNQLGEVMTVLSATNLGAFEWTEIGAPAFVGHHLLASAKTIANTEQALPGDRSVFALRWPSDDEAPHLGQRLNFGQLLDLDVIGPAIDVAQGVDDQVSVRVDHQYPRLVSWASSAALPRLVSGELGSDVPRMANEPLGLATVLGVFGSRTVLGVYSGGTVRGSVIDTSAQLAGRTANPNPDKLPDEAITGTVAATVARGTATFLIPYGDAAPVHAILVDGDHSHVRTLGELRCDQLAVPASVPLNLNVERAFACRRGQDLHVGALFASID